MYFVINFFVALQNLVGPHITWFIIIICILYASYIYYQKRKSNNAAAIQKQNNNRKREEQAEKDRISREMNEFLKQERARKTGVRFGEQTVKTAEKYIGVLEDWLGNFLN